MLEKLPHMTGHETYTAKTAQQHRCLVGACKLLNLEHAPCPGVSFVLLGDSFLDYNLLVKILQQEAQVLVCSKWTMLTFALQSLSFKAFDRGASLPGLVSQLLSSNKKMFFNCAIKS